MVLIRTCVRYLPPRHWQERNSPAQAEACVFCAVINWILLKLNCNLFVEKPRFFSFHTLLPCCFAHHSY